MTTQTLHYTENTQSSNETTTLADIQARREERAYLDRCAMGDEKAIRWVMNRYRDRVVRLASHVLHTPKDAEDVAQEAFVKAFRLIGQFRGESGFYAWLYRIVINICLDRMRRKSATAEMSLEATFLPSICANTPDLDKCLAVEQILNTLSPPMRAALVLREVEGLDYHEISEVLQIPLGTVRSRLNTARDQFRKRWIAAQKEAEDV
ncbi:RNA polymerase sigma factor [Armatimonadota bacterium]|nr:RNA polymerase sigma factor [Armatimonadota bacterium]